jgi:hypothetical protein
VVLTPSPSGEGYNVVEFILSDGEGYNKAGRKNLKIVRILLILFCTIAGVCGIM